MPDQAARHDAIYDTLAAKPEFAELRHRYRRFIIPATIGFVGWYLLYVLLSMFAPGFMNTTVVGHINVALVMGLLQFATTFVIAWLYSQYSNKFLDPLASELCAEYDEDRRRIAEGKDV